MIITNRNFRPVIADHPIAGGAAATAINRAIEGYAFAAACELPRSLPINVDSPNMLEDSAAKYGSLFPGVTPVPGRDVALAYKKSLFGIQTGQVFLTAFRKSSLKDQ